MPVLLKFLQIPKKKKKGFLPNTHTHKISRSFWDEKEAGKKI